MKNDLSSNPRDIQASVDPLFPERWSPRSFDPSYSLSKELLNSLMEAARWAPSCFNEQPWTFHIALREESSYKAFLECLVDSNQLWAKNTSALGYIVGKKKFDKNGKNNSTYEFDCGAAWMSMALEARLLGLYAHGMAGFHREKAEKLLNLNKAEESLIAAFAIGKKDKPELLPEELKQKEKMNSRKDLKQVFKLYD